MKKEVTIAITACVAVVILFFGLNFLKGLTIFSSDSSYYVRFHDIQGLSEANPIYADGHKVGVVKTIYYDYNGNGDIIVKFDVDNNLIKVLTGYAKETFEYYGDTERVHYERYFGADDQRTVTTYGYSMAEYEYGGSGYSYRITYYALVAIITKYK